MPRNLLLSALGFLLVVGAASLVWLRHANDQLRAEIQEKQPARVTANANFRPSLAPLENPKEPAAPAIPSESSQLLWRLRAEVADLEQKAAAHHAAAMEAPAVPADPERAMTKLEQLRNVGQGNPASALQTFFWAGLKGESATMTRILAWDDATRPQAQALLEALSEDTRARYPTPEHLSALFLSQFILDVSAIHIARTDYIDATHATLTVQGLTRADQKLPMRLGPNGWQLLAGEAMLRALRDELAGKKRD